MRPVLRSLLLLLAWAVLGRTVAWAAAPVATNTTNAATIPATNGRTVLTNMGVSDPDGNPTIASYRFVTLPATGVLYAFNTASGASVQITAANQQVNSAQYPNLAYNPATGGATSVTFTFAAIDKTGAVSNTATYTIPVSNTAVAVNQAPLTRESTAQNVRNTDDATLLQVPLFGVDPDGSVASFTIKTIPSNTTQGILALNGTPVTVNQSIVLADAGKLTFDPVAGAFGNVTFTYVAVDNNGLADASADYYSIPVDNISCTSSNVLQFYPRTELEDWSAGRVATVQGVTVTAGSYTSPGGTVFEIENNPTMPGKGLVWAADYPNGATNKTSSVTFSFNRALSGFTMSIGDIDLSTNWTDQVKLEGYTSAGTIVQLAAADVKTGLAATFAAGTNTITGTTGSSTADGNTIITWPQAITKVVVTYSNTTTTADPGQQLMTFESFSWCGQADVTTTLAQTPSVTAVNAGATGSFNVSYSNSAGADDAVDVVAQVQLPANLVGVTFTGTTTGVTGTYNLASGLVTFTGTPVSMLAPGASIASTINFTAPAVGPVAATSTISTSTSEPTSNATNTAPASIAVTPIADLTTTLTGPGSLTAGQTSGNYTVTYTNNGPSVAASTTRTVTIPTTYLVAAPSAPGSTSVTTTGGNYVITYPAGSNVAAGAAGTVSFNFTITPAVLTSTGQTIAVTSNTAPGTGGTSQGGNTATDNSSVSYVVGAVADVSASFTSGPANNATATAGTTATYGVTFTNNGPSPAAGVTRTVSIPTGVSSVTQTGGTLSGSQAAGWTITYPGGAIAAGNTAAYTFSFVVPATGPVTPISVNTTTTTPEGVNALANSGSRTLNVTPIALSGTVFDDVNYGGGAGRPYATANSNSGLASGAIQRAGVTVELYDANNNYLATTTTTAAGLYSFNVPAAADYKVRVVDGTVTPARALVAGGSATGLVPVQTYVYNDVNRVGGETPSLQDAAVNTTSATLTALTTATTTAQSVKTVTIPAGGLTAVDFGFNFDVVVNTNDAGQGSLRQFITNSNTISGESTLAQVYTPTTGATTTLTAGVETSIFMIPNGATVAGQRAGLANQFATTTGTSTAATITLNSALPNITGSLTSIDGSTQTRSTTDTNAAVATSGSESTGPEVVINFNGANGFSTSAPSTKLLNMGLTGSAPAGGSGTAAFGINAGATNAVVQNNTFYTNGANLRLGNVGGATISGNISRNALSNNSDGIEVTASSNNTITNNQFLNNAGFGIDFILGPSTNNTITGNTFSTNGQNTSNGQNAGIGFRSAGVSNNTVSGNIFTNNLGDGISATAGTNNVFSQNSFSNNGDLAIDLANGGALNGDGVTVNATTATRTGANNLVNFPVLTTANIGSTNLVVNGYARPGALVELYLAANDDTNFGEGQSFLIGRTEGSSDDSNAGTGTYGTGTPSTVNGLNQGTDNTNQFTFTIPLSSLSPTLKAALQSGSALLTSTATLANSGTSEFSGNLSLPIADVTVAITGPTTLSAGQATGTYTATFTNEGATTASNVTRIITLPTGASATAAQAPGATIGTNGSGNVTLTYAPLATLDNDASSAVTFAFTAPTTLSTTLPLAANTTTASSEGANTAPDQATLTLNTVATADVTANISASANATTGTFTATFGNIGSQVATGVVPVVQLPAGLVLTGTPTGWSYNSSTGQLTYNTTTSFAANTANALSVTINYLLASAPSAPVTATASVSTTTDEAGNTANNVKSATMSTQFDLTTTLSGPTTTIVGSPTTLYVTTTNNGPNTAGNATQTVTIPSAASLASSIFITNGGMYSYSGTIGTVTFPTLTNVPAGQTITNSISFLAPSASFAPTASVATTSTTETTTANNTAYLNGVSGSSIAVNTVTTPANEATTIAATTVVGGATVPATVVLPGSVVTYTVTSTNKGYTKTTPTATVTEEVQLLLGLTNVNLQVGNKTGTPNGTTLTFASTNGISSTYDQTTGILTYSSVTETSGATTTYPAIAVTTPATVGNGGQLVATASVSTDLQDNVPADNVASVGVKVSTAPDIATTITGPSSTPAGLPVSYVVRFTNNGAIDAITVTETAQLPAGLSNVIVTDAYGSIINGAYSSTTGQITFATTSPLPTSSVQLFTVTLTAPGQSFPVSSTISSATTDGVSTNNSATLTTAVTPNADLAVNISGPATTVVGNPVTYILTTTNNGPTTASTVVPQLQLPKNLTDVDAGTATYTASTGLLTFPTTATLTAGNSIVNYVTFTMPSATATGDAAVNNGLISAVASISSSGTTDAVASNNTAALTTSVAPTTSDVADLATSISPTSTSVPNGTSVPAGTIITYTAAYRNTAGNTATNVVGTVNLPTGLSASTLKVGDVTGNLVGNIITFPASTAGVPAGTTYNTTTGLLTFPTFATYPVSATGNSYSISFPAPVSSGQLVVISEITSSTTETTTVLSPNTTVRANRLNSSITINTVYDVTTALTGPLTSQLGSTNTYTVTTLNNGPSTATNATSQTVTGLPTNLTTTNFQVDGLTGTGTAGTITFKNSANITVATYNAGTLTFPDIAGLPAGAANAAVHSFSLPLTASSLTLTANVSSAGETVNTLPNSVTFSTTASNVAPVAQNVWNTLQSARSNDANTVAPNGLPISSLNATDADGTIGGYTIVTVPDQTQGKLYYNGNLVTALTPITDPTKLTFAPTAGYVGNATFTYYATDNGNGGPSAITLNSPVAIYTIPVAADQEAPAYSLTPVKGSGSGRGAYVAGDVIAYTVDPNVANYGTTGTVYTEDGRTLNTSASNGITSGSAGAFTSSRPDVTTLAALGLTVDTNGRLVVSDPGTPASPKLRMGNYSVVITTVDANGGVTTQTVNFAIPFNPLPVVLTAFTAQTVQNRDAKLSWTTASEVNSAYFAVERSLDGSAFTKIGQVAAQGTATVATDYTFTDANVARLAQGPVYYRLKQVDLDAKASYSPVRTISFTKAGTVVMSLYPNPAQASTTLDLSQLPAASIYHVLVLDATGRTVRQANLGGGLPQPLDLHELASGTYHVLVTGTLADGSALRQTLRLTKE